jgi:hypothetical protein
MQTRKLGKSDLRVSAIGLGCMGMSFGYGPAKGREEMVAVLAEHIRRTTTQRRLASAPPVPRCGAVRPARGESRPCASPVRW